MPARSRRFITLDGFTDAPFGGNPLAIFPEAEEIDETVMQKIAAALNLSETVFVTDATGPAPRLRIVTPLSDALCRPSDSGDSHFPGRHAVCHRPIRLSDGDPSRLCQGDDAAARRRSRRQAIITVSRLPTAVLRM